MTLNLSALDGVNRLLFSIPLEPLQGHRFQPTGFPALGAATFSTKYGSSLLIESAQSMANRLELTIWDETRNDVKATLHGLSHIRVKRSEEFLTDSILESHRINSPYILEGSDKTFFNQIKSELDVLETGPINRSKLSQLLLKYDVSSLLHGVFLAKKELAGGRLRLSRAIEAFIEADGVRVAASGGVKNDHVNPSGDTKSGFGNVPFARDEYTADVITLYAKVDLAQIRGYGLGADATKLLIALALYKIRALIDNDLRLRTACDLRVVNAEIAATKPVGFALPNFEAIEMELIKCIAACKEKMEITSVTFNDELKKGKDKVESTDSEQTESVGD